MQRFYPRMSLKNILTSPVVYTLQQRGKSDQFQNVTQARWLLDFSIIKKRRSGEIAFKMTDFDSILKSVGEFGLFQKKIFLLVQLASIPLFFQNLVLVFVAAQPKWSCIGTPNDLCTPNGTICSKAVFSSEFTSIATEWNLVCSEAYKNELVQSLFMAGNMIGSPWIGGLADQYGRKKLWMISVVLCSFVSFVSAFVKNYNHFLILRFMCGAFAGGGGLVTFVLSTESVGPSYRGKLGETEH